MITVRWNTHQSLYVARRHGSENIAYGVTAAEARTKLLNELRWQGKMQRIVRPSPRRSFVQAY